MKKSLGNGPDAADVEALRVQIEELNKKLEEAKVAELQSKLNEPAAGADEGAPVEEGASAE